MFLVPVMVEVHLRWAEHYLTVVIIIDVPFELQYLLRISINWAH